MFLIRAIREFLKAKSRLGPLWTVESLEPFIVCNLHTEYDMLQTDLAIEVEDYEDIEVRMKKRLHDELERISPLAPPPAAAPPTTEEGDSATSKTSAAKPVTMLEHEHEYEIPPDVYYMQQREELEIHRLARYYQQSVTILNNLYQNPSDFECVSNPFYARLHEIQRSNSDDRMLNTIAPMSVGSLSSPYGTSSAIRGGRQSPYSAARYSDGGRDDLRGGKGSGGSGGGAQIRREQNLLQNVLESLVVAADETRDAWSEYQECTRKILIEVSDLVRQVRQNQAEAEDLAKESEEGKDHLLSALKTGDKGKAPEPPKSAESGADDVESGAAAEEEALKKEHTVRLDVLNAKIVWGHGIPIVDDEDGLPIGPYSPDRPHLPETTLQRLEYLLDEARNSLIGALGIDGPTDE
jgi:hypothetical protein